MAGTVLVNRYRIVSMLGRGGMGEVYKADDLKLDQPVALKFLPDTLALSPEALARFHAEVRIARQVSHPHVCRVYDVGEVDGLHFLTMEFIDGEDLASLLRRIGRLPQGKAVEIARQISAGLAAAHNAGVLHRDLKPANVMIDGRGRARITDFGLAVVTNDARGETTLAGTPAYIAPEVLRGHETSVQSDIYALGLVLYEMFTGRRAVEARTFTEAVLHHASNAAVTTPSHWVSDLDPLIERAILRCLDKDAARRPASAIHVAASLPGGDPLHAAIAAGETPSPEMVAAAGSRDVMRRSIAWPIVAATVLLLLLSAWGRSRVSLLGMVPDPLPPEVLAHKAREILDTFGYRDQPTDVAYGFEHFSAYVNYVRRQFTAPEQDRRWREGRPPAIVFWYRESPAPLVVVATQRPNGPPRIGPVTPDNPPPLAAGMKIVRLDPHGRLIGFEARPPEFSSTPDRQLSFDWDVAFTAAGLDRDAFRPADPVWTPPMAIDQRVAWEGTYPERFDLAVRLEAATYRGAPVAFRTLGAWSPIVSAPPAAPARLAPGVITGVLIMALSIGAAWIAWLNYRAGRGDRRGAFRVAAVLVAANFVEWVLTTDHVTGTGQLILTYLGMSGALYEAAGAYVLYLALEPYVRRRWPQVLVAWSRALTERVRDPLVGRELLVGLALGAVWQVVTVGSVWMFDERFSGRLDVLSSMRRAAGYVPAVMSEAIFVSLVLCFYLFVLRVAVRNAWLAGAILVVTTGVIGGGGVPIFSRAGALSGALLGGMLVLALTRLGLVAAVGLFAVYNAFAIPLTLRVSAWYAGPSTMILAMVGATVAYAGYLATGRSAAVARSDRLVAAAGDRS